MYGWSKDEFSMQGEPGREGRSLGTHYSLEKGKMYKWWGVGRGSWGWELNVSNWDCSRYTCWSTGMIEQ